MTFETHHNGNLPELDYETLRDAVQGGANYLRIRTKLQPADKAGGKVYPPTYAGPEGSHRADEPRYHIEERRSDGETVLAVVLDSVPSQANRAEEALLDAYEDGLVKFPFVEADFSLSADDDSENADYDGITPRAADRSGGISPGGGRCLPRVRDQRGAIPRFACRPGHLQQP